MRIFVKFSLNNPEWDLEVWGHTQYAIGRGGWGTKFTYYPFGNLPAFQRWLVSLPDGPGVGLSEEGPYPGCVLLDSISSLAYGFSFFRRTAEPNIGSASARLRRS